MLRQDYYPCGQRRAPGILHTEFSLIFFDKGILHFRHFAKCGVFFHSGWPVDPFRQPLLKAGILFAHIIRQSSLTLFHLCSAGFSCFADFVMINSLIFKGMRL